MLSTLIYRSRISGMLRAQELHQLVEQGRERNRSMGVTGILLFDGTHFVQLLEGPEAALEQMFEVIQRDERHRNVVLLLNDHAPYRRFEGDQMALADLRILSRQEVFLLIHEKMEERASLACSDDRVFRILMWYALARGTDHSVEGEESAHWQFVADGSTAGEPLVSEPGQDCQFALQPIVDPMRREVTSLEFLIRDRDGGSPETLFASVDPEKRHLMDLESKALAFRMAGRLGMDHVKFSVNLLPKSLTEIPGAVDRLAEMVEAAGLLPSQVIVEVTEQEAISCLKAFRSAIERLRCVGMGVAIDDFGAGFAGLSLLAEFQPDKLKIDRSLIQNIHTSGPRQVIVRSIVQASIAMGITPVAEGVELVDEWSWLQAAGVERFQGYLFARPALARMPEICWPERSSLGGEREPLRSAGWARRLGVPF